MISRPARAPGGRPMPDGTGGGDPGGVVILSAEDDLARTVCPRLEAAGADLARIATVALRARDGGTRAPLITREDPAAVEEAVHETDARLLIVDPAHGIPARRDQHQPRHDVCGGRCGGSPNWPSERARARNMAPTRPRRARTIPHARRDAPARGGRRHRTGPDGSHASRHLWMNGRFGWRRWHYWALACPSCDSGPGRPGTSGLSSARAVPGMLRHGNCPRHGRPQVARGAQADEIVVSRTGVGHGWGSDRWKWVSGLTPEERVAVRAGKIVLITGCPPAGGNYGTTVRQVVAQYGRFGHRLPTRETLTACGETDLRVVGTPWE